VISALARIKLALRAALRRRYSYAALRVLRRGAYRAIVDDLERSLGAAPYVSQTADLSAAYWRALQRLRKRWPGLDLLDERSRP
jgi:hypothetical protein